LVSISLNSTNGERKYRVIIMCYHYMPRTFISGSRPTLPCGGSGRKLNLNSFYFISLLRTLKYTGRGVIAPALNKSFSIRIGRAFPIAQLFQVCSFSQLSKRSPSKSVVWMCNQKWYKRKTSFPHHHWEFFPREDYPFVSSKHIKIWLN